MAVEIGVISGVLELKDEFTSRIDFADIILSRFTAKSQESLKAVAGAVGIVTAAIGLAAAAVYNLGQRGAEVADVEDAFERFSGSAADAAMNLEALREGTNNTIDDFTLMKEAAALLSADVKLNAADFKVLGDAASELNDRGFGPTRDNLAMINDALVTGRTRQLAATVGVIDATKAEEEYAKQLGVKADELSEVGKIEAHRVAILEKLRDVVNQAGEAELDFADRIEQIKTQVSNFVDELAVAIAASPALAEGLQAIQEAISAAFGGSSQSAIETTMEGIKSGAVLVTNFGIAAVEVARVVGVAWESIRTIVLGVETVLVGVITAVSGAVAIIAQTIAHLPGVSQGVKDLANSLSETTKFGFEMTKSLAAQTAESATAVVTVTEYDRTLDSLGGRLMNVKDAIENADAMQVQSNETSSIADSNAKKLAAANKELSDRLVDRTKIEESLWKIEEKSLQETTKLWNDYFRIRTENAGTSFDAQRAAINAWFNDEVSKLDASDRNWQNHYDALAAVAGEKLEAIETDWGSVRDTSIEALQEQARIAKNTYDQMIFGSLHFSREVLEEQRKKVMETADAARGLGKAFVESQTEAADAVDETTLKIRTLSGELITLEEQQNRMSQGGSTNVTSQNFEQQLRAVMTNFGWNPAALGSNIDINEAYQMATKGYSFQEILEIFANRKSGASGPIPPPRGPRIPGFQEGGIVMVGERGPEAVRLPFGSQVFPTGTPAGAMGGGSINYFNTFKVDGTSEQAARKIFDILMRQMKTHRQFGTA